MDEEKRDLVDDESEMLDEEPDYEASPNDESEIPDGGLEEASSSYNPQNRYRQNQEYHNRQYYKDRVNETGQNRKDATNKANEARANRDSSRDALRSARKSGTKEDVKDRKQEYKQARKEDQLARKEKRSAVRENRQAKLDNAADMYNRVRHPGQTAKNAIKQKAQDKIMNPINQMKQRAKDRAMQPINKAKDKAKEAAKNTAKKAGNVAKEGAKKAGKAAAKGAKAAGKAIVNGIAKIIAALPPPVWIAILIILVLLLAAMIIVVVVMGDEDEALQGLSATTCAYENMGGVDEDTVVVIENCDGTDFIESIPLEKYIAGVVVNKLGKDFDTEVLKAELILERTRLLAASVAQTNSIYDPNENHIIQNQCKSDFYWDYNRTVYKSEAEVPEYSYEESSGFPIYREALGDTEKLVLETTAKQVACMYLTDENGNVANVDTSMNNVDKLINQANANKDGDNGSYTALLLQNFGNANKIKSGQTINASYFSSDVGEYSEWKQLCNLGAPWCNVCMNKSCTVKIDSSGCALVSLSMLIKHSGVDTSRIPNFNPGTFTDAMRDNGYLDSGGRISSWAYVKRLVPNFVFHKRVSVGGDISKVRQYAEQGFYIVLEVKGHSNSSGNQHFVAVDNATSAKAGWNDVYIWDPARNITHLSEKKNGYKYRANTMLVYEVRR